MSTIVIISPSSLMINGVFHSSVVDAIANKSATPADLHNAFVAWWADQQDAASQLKDHVSVMNGLLVEKEPNITAIKAAVDQVATPMKERHRKKIEAQIVKLQSQLS